ncbi:MAG TPA: VWA domain-containing protein, partial [bacterium]|nr:VWA domain-containing protein [bacterium]
MSIDLNEFIAGFACAQKSQRVRDTLEGSFAEAQRVMSPNGLKTYLDGATALCSSGKGEDVIISFLEEMPEVVREIGEDAVGETVYSVLKLSSQTSGAVLALLFASLPTAARRLGDIAVFKGYLNLIERMVGLAPRGLRPMLDHIDELLTKLTLGALRRWVMYGAETYRRDFNGQIAYFSLQSSDAMSVMQRERRGILFIDAQRKLQMYLRAFWNREFYLRPTSGDYESKDGYKPYIEKGAIFVPDAYDDYEGRAGMEVYRATGAHAAAHIVYTTAAIQADNLNQLQRLVVALFEDARVEERAIQDFPGLRQLWMSLHPLMDAH